MPELCVLYGAPHGEKDRTSPSVEEHKITLPIPGGTQHQEWMINNGDISIDTGMIMNSYPSFAKITCRIKYL